MCFSRFFISQFMEEKGVKHSEMRNREKKKEKKAPKFLKEDLGE